MPACDTAWHWLWGMSLCLFPLGAGYNHPFMAPEVVWFIAQEISFIHHYISIWELINYLYWPVCLNATCNRAAPRGGEDNGLNWAPRWKIQYHPSSKVSFSRNYMFYILINNSDFISFVPSQLEEKLFKINMWPPAFRVGSEWVEGKMRENRLMTE